MASKPGYFTRYRTDLTCMALLVLAAIIFFFPVWWQGKTFYAFDTLFQYYPWMQKIKVNNPLITDPVHAFYPNGLLASNTFFYNNFDSIFNLPMWNDTIFCGIPFYSYYTTPLKIIFYGLIPPVRAHDIFLFLHLSAVGLFCFLFLRNLKRSRHAALLGAILWMFNGYVMCWFEFESFLLLAATLPAGLLCINRWWRKQSITNWLVMSLVFCWAISSGYAHLFMLQMLFFAIYAAYKILLTKNKRLTIKKSTGILLAVLVCFMSGLNFFLEHYEMFSNSSRVPYGFEELFVKTGRVPARLLPQMIFPFVYGSPTLKHCFTPWDTPSQIYNNFSEMCLYAGVPALLLALASLFGLKRYRFLRFFVAAGIIIVLMTMGSVLYYPMYLLIPGLKLTTASRLLQLFGFCLVVCASFGFDLIMGKTSKFQKISIISILSLISLIAVAFPWLVQTTPGINFIVNNPEKLDKFRKFVSSFFSYSSSNMFLPIIFTLITFATCIVFIFTNARKIKMTFAGILIFSAFIELVLFARQYNTAVPSSQVFPKTPGINFLQAQKKPFRFITLGPFYLNGFAPFGLEDIGGYSSAISDRYLKYVYSGQKFKKRFEFMKRAIFFKNHNLPMLDLINMKYIIAPPRLKPLQYENYKLIYNHEMAVYLNTKAFPRLFIVPKVTSIKSPEQVLAKIKNMNRNDFAKEVVIESSAPEHSITSPDKFSAQLKITKYNPGTIEAITYNSAPGYLVISNSFHPDWKCIVNNKPVEVLRANYIMQAVKLPKGNSTVKLEFKPILPLIFFSISSTIQVALALFLLYNLIVNKTLKEQK